MNTIMPVGVPPKYIKNVPSKMLPSIEKWYGPRTDKCQTGSTKQSILLFKYQIGFLKSRRPSVLDRRLQKSASTFPKLQSFSSKPKASRQGIGTALLISCDLRLIQRTESLNRTSARPCRGNDARRKNADLYRKTVDEISRAVPETG